MSWKYGPQPPRERSKFFDAVGMVAIITGHPVKLKFATVREAVTFVDCAGHGRPGVKMERRGCRVIVTPRNTPKMPKAKCLQCDADAYCRGLCAIHYYRAKRSGRLPLKLDCQNP